MKQLVLTMIFLLSCLGVSQAEMVSIAGEMVNMRSGPGENYEVVWELGKGYPLKVIDKQDDWLKVTDYQDDTGWVQKDLVDRKAYFVVKAKIVNIRSGPGEKYKLVRQAQNGVVLRTLETKSGWVKVKHEEEDVTGWVVRSALWGW
ncbi:MAG: SH3 domain-containing protein [Deltaproteobacteria bacterium]|nr:SH3 domain-containing protein [Deltaproteobacteria bacterium]